MKGGISKDRAI